MARKTRTESYGSDVRRSASYVDRIIKGEKRGDLPMQAPTKYKSTPKVASRLLTSLDMLSFCWSRITPRGARRVTAQQADIQAVESRGPVVIPRNSPQDQMEQMVSRVLENRSHHLSG